MCLLLGCCLSETYSIFENLHHAGCESTPFTQQLIDAARWKHGSALLCCAGPSCAVLPETSILAYTVLQAYTQLKIAAHCVSCSLHRVPVACTRHTPKVEFAYGHVLIIIR